MGCRQGARHVFFCRFTRAPSTLLILSLFPETGLLLVQAKKFIIYYLYIMIHYVLYIYKYIHKHAVDIFITTLYLRLFYRICLYQTICNPSYKY
jgi:hypothetical protein